MVLLRFHRLRRCRVLFALAFCAWLALAGVAWAQHGCCLGGDGAGSAMAGAMSMVHHHGMAHAGHGEPLASPHHDHAAADDCCCAHLPASLPLPAGVAMNTLPVAAVWHASIVAAPQPPWGPPLRPPLA
ncbi:hypothetical protein [Frateuria defendens]|uniref:hypothetical protein n=1 Tax=Frateuria defendens TaxID=2219559 RepID=UPI00066FD51A|nr:hypothetical protein [Frateuria defendens]